MKRSSLFAVLGLMALPVMADNGGHFALGVASDYVWRGLALTRNDVAFQADAGYDHASGFYAGTFWSTVDQAIYPQGGDADLHGEFSGGLRVNTRSGFGWDLGLSVVRFDEGHLGFEEAYLGASFGNLRARVAHDWDHDNTYVEGGAEWDLGSDVFAHVRGGNFSGDTVANYNDYGAGVRTRVAGWDLGLAVTATDIRPKTQATRTHTILSVKRSW